MCGDGSDNDAEVSSECSDSSDENGVDSSVCGDGRDNDAVVSNESSDSKLLLARSAPAAPPATRGYHR